MKKGLIVFVFVLLLSISFASAGFLDFFKSEPEFSPADKYIGLPDDFVPVSGYYSEFEGGETVLFDTKFRWFATNDGVEYRRIGYPYGLPRDFMLKTAYWHPFGGGRVILIDDRGSANIIKEDEIMFRVLNLDIPNRGVIEVGYYHGFGNGGGRVVLEDSNNSYIWNPNSQVWSNFSLGEFGLPNEASEVSYYFNVDRKEIHKWYSNGSVYAFNGSGDFRKINSEIKGLEDEKVPSLGYFDTTNDEIVLWFGTRAYTSSDGRNFDPAYGVVVNGKGEYVCKDDDGGDDYNEFGTVRRSYQEDIQLEISDCCTNTLGGECANSGPYILETFCNGIIPSKKPFECKHGCIEGECINPGCIDSDEFGGDGRNYTTKGNVTDTSDRFFQDSCENDGRLAERTCGLDGEVYTYLHTCTNGCLEGACIGDELAEITCELDSDCLDDDDRTVDSCNSEGVCESVLDEDPEEGTGSGSESVEACSIDNQCGDRACVDNQCVEVGNGRRVLCTWFGFLFGGRDACIVGDGGGDTNVQITDECIEADNCVYNCESGQLVGDVNQNGVLDEEDGELLGIIILNRIDNDQNTICLDVDVDGDVTAFDATLIGFSSLASSCSDGRELGDVDGNGWISGTDAAIIQQMLVGTIQIPNDISCIDVSGNRQISSYDAGLILEYDEGRRDSFDDVNIITSISCEPGQLPGDLNNNGVIDEQDVRLMVTIFYGRMELPEDISCIDINGDGDFEDDSFSDVLHLISIWNRQSDSSSDGDDFIPPICDNIVGGEGYWILDGIRYGGCEEGDRAVCGTGTYVDNSRRIPITRSAEGWVVESSNIRRTIDDDTLSPGELIVAANC